MTKTIPTNSVLYSFLYIGIALVVAMTGVMTVQASEVTGTLSSDTSGVSQTTGDINDNVSGDTSTSGNLTGTVSSGSGSGGSSGGSRQSGSLSNTPSGLVLGESISDTSAPGFPNAGVAPTVGFSSATVWSTVITFITNIISF